MGRDSWASALTTSLCVHNHPEGEKNIEAFRYTSRRPLVTKAPVVTVPTQAEERNVLKQSKHSLKQSRDHGGRRTEC